MEQTPADRSPGEDALQSAGDKLTAAFTLLAAAFEDTRIDSITLTKADLLEQAAAAQRVLNVAWAVQSARLAQAAAIEEIPVTDPTSPDGHRIRVVRHAFGAHQDEFIGCEVGPVLGWASGHALARVSESVDYLTRTPRLFGWVGTGELEPAKLASIHRALGRVIHDSDREGNTVTLDLARQVETALLGDTDPADSTPEAAAAEDAAVELLTRQSTRQVQQRTDRVLRTLDPVSASKAATRRRRDRVGVFAHPDDEPGLTHLHAILDSPVAAKLMAAVDQLARDLHADTTTDKTLAECRADALADLALVNATVTTSLVIQIPVHVGAEDTTAGAAQGHAGSAFWPAAFAHPITGLPVYPHGRPTAAATAGATTATMVTPRSQERVDREFKDLLNRLYPPHPDDFADWEFDDEYAPFDRPPDHAPPDDYMSPPDDSPPCHAGGRTDPSALSRSSAARLGDGIVPGIGVIPAAVIEALSRSFGMTITRALVDATTGITLETCETQYRPSARLARYVRTRDVHCRFPGCTRPARWCDLDHLTAWPGGPTAAASLHCLCRHHHRTKQENGWSVTMTPDGICTWTSPTGRTYITSPGE